MLHYIIHPEADMDVFEIASYIGRDNWDASDRQIDLFTEKFELLARNPYTGRNREDFAAGLRSFPVGAYIIFYRLREEGIEISRVLNASRDVDALF